MRFEISHVTRYSYSEPVCLGHHLFRLRPSDSGYQRLLDHSLAIDPQPVMIAENLDAWGNQVHEAWFEGETGHLEISMSLTVETLRTNAFDFMLAPYPMRLPMDYGEDAHALLRYLSPVEDEGAVSAFISPLVSGYGNDPLAFLEALTDRIHGFYRHGLRLDGAPYGPAETIRRREGVCRDLTVLFIAACRAAGIAARFVSGYQKGDGSRTVRYLHAWPEAYIPGGGWRAYDPTHNAMVTDTHVAVAQAANPAGAMPVTGGFSGRHGMVDTRMDNDLQIRTGK